MDRKYAFVALATLALALAACNRAPDPAAASTDAPAAPASQATPQAAPASATPASATAEGTVVSTDAAGGTITLEHGPVPALNWPGMTMPFKASPEQIAAVKAGDKVEIEFDSKDYVLTRITVRQ